jgi:GNAT superfamily N-acetyltransferase
MSDPTELPVVRATSADAAVVGRLLWEFNEEFSFDGLGTALLRAAVDLVRSRRGGEIHINVDEVDVDTRRFYERHGFTNIQPGEDYRMLCYLREL